MTWNRKNTEMICVICIITVFMGQIYISPFNKWFRLSFAVITLSNFFIYFKNISPIVVGNIVAVLMLIFRSFVYYVTFHDITFKETLFWYFPVTIFYVSFGFLFEAIKVREKLHSPVKFIICLWVCDSLSNILEATYRSFVNNYSFDHVVLGIILMGMVRSLATYFLYYIVMYYKNRYDRQQKERKYREMVMFISSLKSELFFLKKSMVDIEDTMHMSYMLYQKLNDLDLREDALTISKNIHEIKKDYSRVVSGIENTLCEENKNMCMSVEEIFDIIRESTKKLIYMKNKNIILKFTVNNNFSTYNLYPLISVLNNLIINSIEAIESEGTIVVKEKMDNENYIFRVIDNGIGMEDDDIDIIFEPGFSTKYDTTTGKMSTGIGLSHVKQIVENYYKGRICIDNTIKNYTAFEITIPIEQIETGEVI